MAGVGAAAAAAAAASAAVAASAPHGAPEAHPWLMGASSSHPGAPPAPPGTLENTLLPPSGGGAVWQPPLPPGPTGINDVMAPAQGGDIAASGAALAPGSAAPETAPSRTGRLPSPSRLARSGSNRVIAFGSPHRSLWSPGSGGSGATPAWPFYEGHSNWRFGRQQQPARAGQQQGGAGGGGAAVPHGGGANWSLHGGLKLPIKSSRQAKQRSMDELGGAEVSRLEKPWLQGFARRACWLLIVSNSTYLLVQPQIFPNDLIYFIVELCFIIVFTAELVIRYYDTEGWEEFFWFSSWNRYDIFVLLVALVDVAILGNISRIRDVHLVFVMLLPLFQLVRLGRFVPELHFILVGMIGALRTIGLSMFLLGIVIYFFAMVTHQFVGKAAFVVDDSFVQSRFGTVSDAMFSLMSFATLEDYTETVRHFMHHDHAEGAIVAMCIVVFMVLTNCALLNLITAVVVDSIFNVLSIKRTRKLEEERMALLRRLQEICRTIDSDRNGQLSEEEFMKALDEKLDLRMQMSRLGLCAYDIMELFHLIQHSRGEVSIDDFTDGLMCLVPGEASTKKELLYMQYDVTEMWSMLSESQERLEKMVSDSNDAKPWSPHMENLERLIGGEVARNIAELSARLERVERAASGGWASQVEECFRGHAAECVAKMHDVAQSVDAGSDHLMRSIDERLEHLREDFRQQLLQHQQQLLLLRPSYRPGTLLLDGDDAASRASEAMASSHALAEPAPPAISPLTSTAPSSAVTRGLVEVNGIPAMALTMSRPPTPQSVAGRHAAVPTRSRTFPDLPPVNELVSQPSTQLTPLPTPASAAFQSQELSLQQRQLLDQQQKLQQVQEELEEHRDQLQRLHQLQVRQQGRRGELLLLDGSPANGQLQLLPQQSPLQSPHLLPQQLQQLDMQQGEAPNFAEDQAMLQSLLGVPPSPVSGAEAQEHERIRALRMWVMQQAWGSMPFHRLVLQLDRVGVRLSVHDQDLLRRALQ